MQTARFFLKLKRSPLTDFCEQGIYLKSALGYPISVCKFTSSTCIQTKCGRSCEHTSQIIPSRKFFSDVPRKIGMQISERKDDVQSQVAKNKNKKISILTKSKDPDTFGDMESFHILDTIDLEDKLGDESEFHEDCKIFIPLDRKYRSPADYFHGMKTLVREKKLKQALELFLEMRRHNVPPAVVHYTFMIGACGRAGYTEMAFKLLRQMTDKGFKPTSATLTGLFNSCAESPNAEYALKKAKLLKEKVSFKSWEVTVPTYHAMIKAFGRCGDIGTAFEIVDEMIKAECRITAETYNTLLISCISDKDAGFTHAIEVWRKMISKKILPNLFSYNLLLRAARDCGVGPEEVSCNLLQHWSSHTTCLFGEKKTSREDVVTLPRFPHRSIKLLSEPVSHDDAIISSQEKADSSKKGIKTGHANSPSGNDIIEAITPDSVNNTSSPSHMVLNLLSRRPVSGPEFVDLEKVKYPADRLLLIGGVKGVLELMKKDEVTPDIKTFTLLLKIIPDSTEHENELLSLTEKYQLELDVDFFNVLIKKRNFRKNFKAAKEALVLITNKGLCPDIATFGVLALGCRKKKDGMQLLRDMQNIGFCPNIEIFGALLNSASRQMDFEYICTLLKAMKIEKIQPSPKFLQMLENIKNATRGKILSKEKGKEISGLPFSEKSYNEFCQLYEQWLKSTNVEEQVDPWLQYKTEITDRVHEAPYHM